MSVPSSLEQFLASHPWTWEWVPSQPAGAEVREAWTEHLTSLFAEWTSAGISAARAALPVELIDEAFATPEAVGRGVAEWLLERADQLPPWSRLAWGAVAVSGEPRWAPVPVIVEFRTPHAEDSAYLMDEVGARGAIDDAREPIVEYVSTVAGDGIRVFALGRGSNGEVFARLDAALRLDVPTTGRAKKLSADVVLSTRVFDLGLMSLIGHGMERLMEMIADECLPHDGQPPNLSLGQDVPAVHRNSARVGGIRGDRA
jgi:hypothetical protein